MHRLEFYVCSRCLTPHKRPDMKILADDINICKRCAEKKKTIEEPVRRTDKLLIESLL